MSLYRYSCNECAKTYIGTQLPDPMQCNCTPAKKIRGILLETPLSDALTEEISTSKAATLRSSMCAKWGITSKSHVSHGANFSSNQTVVNLINDIVKPVQGDLRESVRRLVIREFSYDINSRKMVD